MVIDGLSRLNVDGNLLQISDGARLKGLIFWSPDPERPRRRSEPDRLASSKSSSQVVAPRVGIDSRAGQV